MRKKLKTHKTKLSGNMLENFLRENNAYEAFIENVGTIPDYLTDPAESEVSTTILGAFIWDGSNQGEMYWRDLHNKAVEYEKKVTVQ
mgnify:CR=1 FL=1